MKKRFDALPCCKSIEIMPAVWIVHRFKDEEGDEHTVIMSSECRTYQDVEHSISALIEDLEKAKKKALCMISKSIGR